MNKAELIVQISERTGLQQKDAKAMLNATFDAIAAALTEGDRIQIAGFGTFEVRTRAARQARNPRTKEPIDIPETKAPVFKAGKGLKELVNG